MSARSNWPLGHPHLTLAAPHTHDAHAIAIESVHDAKRRMDDLAKLRDTELRDDPAALREVRQPLDLEHDLLNQALTDFGDIELGVPRADLVQVPNRGRGEADAASARHLQAKPSRLLTSPRSVSRPSSKSMSP